MSDAHSATLYVCRSRRVLPSAVVLLGTWCATAKEILGHCVALCLLAPVGYHLEVLLHCWHCYGLLSWLAQNLITG